MNEREPAWLAKARSLVGRESRYVLACDAVNAPMIRHWCEAFGFPLNWADTQPAPATMLQPWIFPGSSKERPPMSAAEDATVAAQSAFAEGGFTGVVTANMDLEFLRTVVTGDRLAYTSELESISEEKKTGLGIGRFLGYRFTIVDADVRTVGVIKFTNLVYRPEVA